MAIPEPERWDTAVLPLATLRVGRPLWHYERVDSTMPLAHELAAAGAPDGSAILAEEQTGGRGRRGRPWVAPAGSAILCSLLFRPPLRADELFLLTAAVSVGLCAGIEGATGARPAIKWPNDLLLDGRKLAGILTESRFAGATPDHAVVGFGLNVSVRPADLPALPGAVPPTSLAIALGRAPGRPALLRAVLEGIDRAYDLLWRGRRDELREGWMARLAGIGSAVRVETDAGPQEGVFAGVAPDGALVLTTAAGQVRILAGDVVLGPRGIA